MKRLKAILRDTWWLWTIFLLMGTLLGIFFEPVFFACFPIAIVTFVYFMLMRYDDEGNPREDL